MIDLSHLPAGADVQMFMATATANTDWRVWNKPRGHNYVYIWAVGPGCGGAGGFSAATGSTKGGGGGGGSGGVTSGLWIASTLPNRLLVRARSGTSGGAAGAASFQGQATVVATYDNLNISTQSLLIRANAGLGASAGTGSAGGAGGAGVAAQAASNCPLVNLALMVSFSAGAAGTNGNILTPLDTSIGSTLPILGGAGGGGYTAAGTASAGGKVAFSGYLPDLPGGTAGGVTAGRGSDGLWLPPYIFGGTGGGGTNDAVSTGGRGGDGIAPGAGGGGGGAGVTGGAGGNGGPGLVVIVSWP